MNVNNIKSVVIPTKQIQVLIVAIASLFVFSGAEGGCGGGTPEPQIAVKRSGSFRALTYNVAGLPLGFSSSNPGVNTIKISPLLNNYDLILLQEDFAYHDVLISDVDHPYQTEPVAPEKRWLDDGLNRLSLYRFSDHRRVQWDTCYGGMFSGASDCLAEKGFSMAVMSLTEQAQVHVYNLHAEAGGGQYDNLARAANTEQLISYILKHSHDEAILIGGDFNLSGYNPIDEPLLQQLMVELGVTDSCRHLDCKTELIDRIFFRSSDQIELVPTSWRIGDEFVDSQGAMLSDHNAVNVNFQWSRPDEQ